MPLKDRQLNLINYEPENGKKASESEKAALQLIGEDIMAKAIAAKKEENKRQKLLNHKLAE